VQGSSFRNSAGLLKIQRPAVRKEFCPWSNQLMPLVNGLNMEFDETKARGLVEFIKKFGLINLPKLAKVTIDLYEYVTCLKKK